MSQKLLLSLATAGGNIESQSRRSPKWKPAPTCFGCIRRASEQAFHLISSSSPSLRSKGGVSSPRLWGRRSKQKGQISAILYLSPYCPAESCLCSLRDLPLFSAGFIWVGEVIKCIITCGSADSGEAGGHTSVIDANLLLRCTSRACKRDLLMFRFRKEA